MRDAQALTVSTRWITRSDDAYPGVKQLPDRTFVTTTYGHWGQNESPFIASVCFKLGELDAKFQNGTRKTDKRLDRNGICIHSVIQPT